MSRRAALWGDILGALRQEAPRAQLILNQLNPLVRTAVTIDEPELARTSAEALYGQAAMLSRRPLRPAESSLINRSFLDLARPRPPQGQLTMPTAPHPQNTDELFQALQENDQRPYGRTRTVTAEELVDAAEQFAEPGPLVHALLELQEAYTYGSEPRKSPVVFARLLTLFDEQPDVFDERLRHMLFWRFKWVSNALRALPEIPLASLRQWLTEMRDRYEKAGLGLQPYYGQAYQARRPRR